MLQNWEHERGGREICCGASEGVGGADGGGAENIQVDFQITVPQLAVHLCIAESLSFELIGSYALVKFSESHGS